MSIMVKAISLHQPWASAIALGTKRIETRHWSTAYRGPLLIHAAKTREWLGDDGLCDLALTDLPADPPPGWPETLLPLGAIVAIGQLVAMIRTETLTPGRHYWNGSLSFDFTSQEGALGNYAPGRVGWLLADVRPLPVPIPFRGQQNIFPVPAEILPERYRP